MLRLLEDAGQMLHLLQFLVFVFIIIITISSTPLTAGSLLQAVEPDCGEEKVTVFAFR